ncbi:MAG: septation protein SpoVG family protein [Rhodospirillales bacterium]|nr:septation protein SpoVG family protein [Rhodospirillales bacterium]
MKISDVNITLITPQGGLIGFASFVLHSTFYVSGVAIHEKRDGSGHRLTYPTRKSGGQVFNICHPTNRQASKAVENAIFQKLKDVLNQGCEHAGYDCDQFTAR